MILVLIWLLMRFWDMSVHNSKKRQFSTNRECDSQLLLHANCEVGLDSGDYKSSRSSSDGFGGYLKGTNHFLRGLLAKTPLSQLFGDNNNCQAEPGRFSLPRELSISQLLVELGALDTEALRSELAFMGISEDFLLNNDSEFQWSQEYNSFEEDECNGGNDANLLSMSRSYEDMARHLDAHLAELDIENFRAEDINSLLNLKSNLEFQSSRLGEDQLFAPLHGRQHYLSTDSLDSHGLKMVESSRLDGADEEEGNGLLDSIRVSSNCQGNKENYTLAFKDDSYSDSQTSIGSRDEAVTERKVSWNRLGNSNNSNQSFDSSGSFVGGWNMPRRSTPPKGAMSPPDIVERQNLNLVKMFMKQRTMSTSSTSDTARANGTTEEASLEDCTRSSSRYRKKSMNDSGKCSTLSQHVLDEEEEEEGMECRPSHLTKRFLPNEDEYQLDSLDVVQSAHRPREGLSGDKRESVVEERQSTNSKSIQTSKQFANPARSSTEKVLVFPECQLPNLDFVHLEHDVLTSQFVTGEQINQLNGSHPRGFDHIVDWDSLLFLLSREHKEMLKKYPVLSERIRNSFQDSVSDVFDEFPETIDVTFEGNTNICDCDSLISSMASNNSSNRYSSDSGLGPNTYNFEDLRKLFVYEYHALDEETEAAATVQMRAKDSRPQGKRIRERRYTMCAMAPPSLDEEEAEKQEKRVSFQQGLPKKRSNKSTSSIPRLIKHAQGRDKERDKREPRVVSRIPKLIKSPSKSKV